MCRRADLRWVTYYVYRSPPRLCGWLEFQSVIDRTGWGWAKVMNKALGIYNNITSGIKQESHACPKTWANNIVHMVAPQY